MLALCQRLYVHPLVCLRNPYKADNLLVNKEPGNQEGLGPLLGTQLIDGAVGLRLGSAHSKALACTLPRYHHLPEAGDLRVLLEVRAEVEGFS